MQNQVGAFERELIGPERRDRRTTGYSSYQIFQFYSAFLNLKRNFVEKYEGGTFLLEIKIPDTYPFNPPKVKFTTRIWHPNISSVTGAICLDILKDQWAAAMTLRTVLLSIQALLASAEPDDPQDAVVANQYKNHFSIYKKTARHWTNIYAGSASAVESECDNKVKQLVDMGFEPVKMNLF